MSELKNLAMQFCKACLRWHNPEFGETTSKRKYVERLDRNGFDKFYFEDLGSVMNYVREWCDETGKEIRIEYSPSRQGFGVFCGGVDTWHGDLKVAVMSACADAR